MARPAKRDPSGNWSLAQIANAAGITPRSARTIAANGYLGDPADLTAKHIPLARVAAHLLDAPRPTGLPRHEATDATTKRNFDALALAQQVIDDPVPAKEAALLVGPTAAVLIDTTIKALAHIQDTTDPLLLLPVGAWVIQMRQTLLTGAAS